MLSFGLRLLQRLVRGDSVHLSWGETPRGMDRELRWLIEQIYIARRPARAKKQSAHVALFLVGTA